MKFTLKKTSTKSHVSETLVLYVGKSGEKLQSLQVTDKSLDQKLAQLKKEKIFRGESKESVFFRDTQLLNAQNLLLVGLGDLKALDHESLRIAGATTHSGLKSNKVTSADVIIESLFRSAKESSEALKAFIEGVVLGSYEYDELKHETKRKENQESRLQELQLLIGAKANPTTLKKSLDEALIIAESTNLTRRLGDTPANYMNPEMLAGEAQKAAKGTAIKVTVWDRARIKKERFGGLLGVSLGGGPEPRFIIMEYKGGGKKPMIALVGKGLTFDAGGISIKPSQGMDEMRYDMCGGAAVIGAMVAIARLKLKVNVTAYVPATENMLGPMANKPGDVLIARNGKSIEVLNTDAEGRLILADALSYASEQKPAAIFDTATLTGAIVVALGNIHTGVFSNNDKLRKTIDTAAGKSGEQLWHMPVTAQHNEDMKGQFADLSNISSSKGAGSSTAAAFLQNFVGEGIPWAHFDIAGTAWHTGNRLAYCPNKGASGVMVRTFVELAKMF